MHADIQGGGSGFGREASPSSLDQARPGTVASRPSKGQTQCLSARNTHRVRVSPSLHVRQRPSSIRSLRSDACPTCAPTCSKLRMSTTWAANTLRHTMCPTRRLTKGLSPASMNSRSAHQHPPGPCEATAAASQGARRGCLVPLLPARFALRCVTGRPESLPWLSCLGLRACFECGWVTAHATNSFSVVVSGP